ncbi:uncharacterized protein LOC144017154 [Festucalex cinctus]
MCKVEMLRALLNQRLRAAVEEVIGVFARTLAEYEEELCRTKEENEHQRQLLAAVCKPQVVLHGEESSSKDYLPAEQQEWISKEGVCPCPLLLFPLMLGRLCLLLFHPEVPLLLLKWKIFFTDVCGTQK